jgi:hypothetical protein
MCEQSDAVPELYAHLFRAWHRAAEKAVTGVNKQIGDKTSDLSTGKSDLIQHSYVTSPYMILGSGTCPILGRHWISNASSADIE